MRQIYCNNNFKANMIFFFCTTTMLKFSTSDFVYSLKVTFGISN